MNLMLLPMMLGVPTPPPSDIIAPGAKLQMLANGFSFTEGPVSDRAGNVYFTDQPNDRILKWNTDGSIVEWMKPCGRSNGLEMDRKGNIVACADDKNEIWSISPSQKVTVLAKDFQGKLLNGPNDLWIRPDGGIYITDPLYARPYWTRSADSQQPGNQVFYMDKSKGALVAVITDLKTPNGIVGTPDGKYLYVADLGANATFKYEIQKDGSLTNKTQFCALGSDGMTIDDEGDLYLTGKGVTVFDKTGKQIEHIDVPEDWVGNICFAGKGHHELFITASHSIYSLKMRVHGVR